jgi:hypothetical protein
MFRNDKMDVDDVTQIELDNTRAVEGVIENVVAAQMDEAIAPLHIREVSVNCHRDSHLVLTSNRQAAGEDRGMSKTGIVS